MSYRTNDAIGKAGERQIKKELKKLGCTEVQINKHHNGHPDCTFILGGKKYAAECKSMLPFTDKQVSHIHLRRSEVAAMLQSIQDGFIPCLIVDIRPRGTKIRMQYFIEWYKVQREYNQKQPAIKSLSFYWILDNGCKIEHAIQLMGT